MLIANFFVTPNIKSQEIFNFNVTNIEISKNGNLFKGYGGGEANTNDGIKIIADRFEYDKVNTILSAEGNVFYEDTKRNIIIEATKIIYLKKLETIKASGDIKIIDNFQKIILTSENLKYSKNKKLFEANKNVEINDINRDLYIRAEKILYFSKNQEIIADTNARLINNKKNISVKAEKISYKKKLDRFFTSGITEADIYSSINFYQKDVNYDGNLEELSSVSKTQISK